MLTLDPPSMIISGNPFPLMITITAGLFSSTTTGPSLESVKYVDVIASFDGASANFETFGESGH
mgnify:CR=1 FL=1